MFFLCFLASPKARTRELATFDENRPAEETLKPLLGDDEGMYHFFAGRMVDALSLIHI